MRPARPRRLLALSGVLALAVTATTAAATDPTPDPGLRWGVDVLTLEDLGGPPSPEALDWATVERRGTATTGYTLDYTITSVQVVETTGEDVLVTLASDLLFDVDSAELGDAARQRVTELASEVPQGATFAVDGHTDSVASDAYNQDLSERRARAVADAVAAARPDLVLEVRGHGESALKVDESGDDIADDRAQNRRVELRYRAPGAVATDTETTPVDPVPAPYVPGKLRAEPVDPEAVVAEHVVPVPVGEGAEAGAQVRVGVEEVLVRGPVARIRFQLTPLDTFGDDDWNHVYELTGGELYVQVSDPAHLTTYRPARYVSSIEWESYPFQIDARAGETVRYETYVARPLEDVDTLDVSLVPQWPRFEGVPVVWDR